MDLHQLRLGKTESHRYRHAFGVLEDGYGLVDLPVLRGNVALSRVYHERTAGCTECFPEGPCARARTDSRSWKNYRAHQHKVG